MLTPLASTSRQTAKSASHSAGGSAAEGSSRTSREIAPWVSSSARAIARALRSTAFSSATGQSMFISTLIRASSSRVRRRCWDQAILPAPWVAKPETRPTFSVAVSSPIRPRSWWTKRRPRRRASSAELTSSGSPSTSTRLPGSGSWKPERTLIRVDLPDPFSPTRAWISALPISKETSFRARCPGNVFERCSILIRGSGVAAVGSGVADSGLKKSSPQSGARRLCCEPSKRLAGE